MFSRAFQFRVQGWEFGDDNARIPDFGERGKGKVQTGATGRRGDFISDCGELRLLPECPGARFSRLIIVFARYAYSRIQGCRPGTRLY